MARRSVKGERIIEGATGDPCIIRESIIGETPVVLGRDDEPLMSEAPQARYVEPGEPIEAANKDMWDVV